MDTENLPDKGQREDSPPEIERNCFQSVFQTVFDYLELTHNCMKRQCIVKVLLITGIFWGDRHATHPHLRHPVVPLAKGCAHIASCAEIWSE